MTSFFFEINLLSFFKSMYVYECNYTFAKICHTAELLLIWTRKKYQFGLSEMIVALA